MAHPRAPRSTANPGSGKRGYNPHAVTVTISVRDILCRQAESENTVKRVRAAVARPVAMLSGLAFLLGACAACASTAARPAATSASESATPSAPVRSAPKVTSMATSSPSQTASSGSCPTLTIGTDGSVAPLLCASGADNPAALAYYEGGWVKGFTPRVLALPATASYGQVVGAVCADVFGHGSPMGLQTEQQAYTLAANRAGWQYHINTVNGLNCPVVGASWAPGVQGYGQVEPETISNNGDPTGLVTHITWSSWGGAMAHGTGLSTWVPPGQPTVDGTQEQVTIVVFNPGTCAGKQSYNAVSWYFPQHGQQFSGNSYFNACTGQRVGT